MVDYALPTPQCRGCDRYPYDISEYVHLAQDYCCTPNTFVQKEEGTYNRQTGLFWCTACYIRIGMPTGTA